MTKKRNSGQKDTVLYTKKNETIEVQCSTCGKNVDGYMVGVTPVSRLHTSGPLGVACTGSGCAALKVD